MRKEPKPRTASPAPDAEAELGRFIAKFAPPQRALELTIHEASRLRAEAADAEHLLLGLCAEEQGIAAQVLDWAGLTTERARAEVARIRGDA